MPDKFANSRSWWERAEKVIPFGTQTLSKSPTQWVQGALPIYLSHGVGAHVFDVDGNEFIDYPMALGPVLLGHAEPAVNAAIAEQLDKGITFTMMHPLEVEVAERLVNLIPGVEAVRFGKSGSDALTGAVRAARAYTGRDIVLAAGYHGWHDWYIGTTTRDGGVPAAVRSLTSTFSFNDLESLTNQLHRHEGKVAAVVLEPSGADVPNPGFLQKLVSLTREAGAVSIFDEVITGFRLGVTGARGRYNVEPDISCYGKALGNGMPISAIGGRWEIMSVFEDIFFSGTHGGETLSLAAARAVLDLIEDGATHAQLFERGTRMLTGIQRTIDAHGLGSLIRVGGEPERAVLAIGGEDPLLTKSFVQQTLADHGSLFNGGMFICARHTDEDIDSTLAAFDEAFETIAVGKDLRPLLKGDPVQPVFRAP